jgi:foldase protein PrsA
MRANKIISAILTGALCVSIFTGCGINKNATAATMNDQTVSLGVANFFCRFEQASIEDYYKSMLGSSSDDFWSQDFSGDGTTLESNMIDSAMESLHEMYTLQANMGEYNVELTDDDKAAITEAATAFLEANSEESLKEMGADQDVVEEVLTLYTIKSKMDAAIYAEVDTDVSDEEANMRAYSMVKVDTDTYEDEDGETVDYSDDEVEDIKANVQTMVDGLKEDGATLETAAEAAGYEVTTGTYDNDDDSLDEEVKDALDDLKEGETSGVVETDSACYVLRIDSDTDEDATESNRESIIETRKSDHYNEVIEAWQENDGWKINNKAIAKISFHNSLTLTDPNASTETEEATETVDYSDTTESVDTTEAVGATEAAAE